MFGFSKPQYVHMEEDRRPYRRLPDLNVLQEVQARMEFWYPCADTEAARSVARRMRWTIHPVRGTIIDDEDRPVAELIEHLTPALVDLQLVIHELGVNSPLVAAYEDRVHPHTLADDVRAILDRHGRYPLAR